MSDLHNTVVREEILYFLEKAWRKYPNLRLMQLLGNGFAAGDNYYLADQSVLDYLVKLVNEVED
jgi:uncharacterized protein YihD (DUF1040 family)